MTKTTNYQLPKWEKTDRVQMKDFNDMTATLDAALKTNADTAAAASAAVALCGNCKIYCTSFVGTGTAAAPTMTFPHKPLIIFVSGRDALNLIAWRGQSGSRILESPSSPITVTWGERSVAWSGSDYLNHTGFTHQVIALLDAED